MRKLGALLAATVAATGVIVVSGGLATAAPQSQTFSFTGAPASFTVPSGICSVTVAALGARGGDNAISDGGLGGGANARITVTPNEILQVRVGGHGADGNNPAGGFNGGGTGGNGAGVTSPGDGGGGATDIRRAPYTDADRLVVAGGGGGAPNGSGGDGGAGGGTSGNPGTAPANEGGLPGTQTAAGDHGTGGDNGTAGSGAIGGNGGSASVTGFADGGAGGGGGGYFGGGGGNAHPNTQAPAGPGGGGGGSGFTPDGTGLSVGVQDGDGQLVVTFDPVTDSCGGSATALEPSDITFTG